MVIAFLYFSSLFVTSESKAVECHGARDISISMNFKKYRSIQGVKKKCCINEKCYKTKVLWSEQLTKIIYVRDLVYVTEKLFCLTSWSVHIGCSKCTLWSPLKNDFIVQYKKFTHTNGHDKFQKTVDFIFIVIFFWRFQCTLAYPYTMYKVVR